MRQILYAERTDGIAIDRIRRGATFTTLCKHLHDEYGIYYLLGGRRYYFIDRRAYHVTGGSLVFIDRDQIYQVSQAGPGNHERILISLDQNPFSNFLAFIGEMSLEGFFHHNPGIPNLDRGGQNLAEYLLDGTAKGLHKKSWDSDI